MADDGNKDIPGLAALKLPVPEPGDAAKIQAMIGSAKAQNTTIFQGKDGEEITLTADDHEVKATLLFANCKDCTFMLEHDCTKVFADRCVNTKFIFKSRVITKTSAFRVQPASCVCVCVH
jgi:hypothetical protein